MRLTEDQTRLLQSGAYAQKQIFSKSKLMSYSHSKRFEFAWKLIKRLNKNSLLDYGCGDATFLIYCKNIIKEKIGYDYSESTIKENRTRLADEHDFRFLNQVELDSVQEKYEVITCMEVLEHCTPETIDVIKANFKKLLADDGVLIVSVPIETGGAVIIKQTVRRILGWLKFGSYEHSEYYTFLDFFRMLFASDKQSVPRNYYDVAGYMTCGHYAFNWKVLKKSLESDFLIYEQHYTPASILGSFFNSQVWFLAKKR